MFTCTPTDNSKFILLRPMNDFHLGPKHPGFFSSYNKNDSDPTKLTTGQVAYEIIGYADTVEEAQTKLYGPIRKSN